MSMHNTRWSAQMAQKKPKPERKSANDAIAVLTRYHKEVRKMFRDFENLKENDGGDDAKSALVGRICMELTVHAQIEEEIFYPAVRAAIGNDDLMDEADVEHAGAKDLIAQLVIMEPGDDHYDAKVTVLGQYVSHHVKEEHDALFPRVRRAGMDTQALGERIVRREKDLQGGRLGPR
jgi:hemerythrin superfamily protein